MSDFTKKNCDRCGNPLYQTRTVSMFNTETICVECKYKEKTHPKYREACDAEMAAIKNGDMNFSGIGLPEDLKQ